MHCRDGLPFWYSSFLDARQQTLALVHLNSVHWYNYCFWGGFEDAERKILILFCDVIPIDVSISCLKINYGKEHSLTHRDFLGSLMSLGIKRNVLGDILIQKDCTFIFIKSNIGNFIIQELISVGKTNVKVEEVEFSNMNFSAKREIININVASLRLDVIVSALLHISRQKSVELILSGDVLVNSQEIKKVSYALFEKDIFSVKKYGKYLFTNIDGYSKKGRFFISIEKFN